MTTTLEHLHQIRILTWSNMKSRYRKTIAGFLWVTINPLIMFGVQSLVFKHIMKVNLPNYSLFLVSGLLPWIFVQQSLEMSTSIFVMNGRMLKSFNVHPMVYLSAQLLDNFINFFFTFTLLLIPVWYTSHGSAWGLLLCIIPIILLAIAVLGMSWFLATLHIFFRDTRFIVTFVLSFAYFLTPVFYPKEFVPPKLQWITDLNPFQYLILPFQIALHHFDFGAFRSAAYGAAAIAMASCALAALIWKKKKNDIYFYI